MWLGRDRYWWWGYRYRDLVTREFWENGNQVQFRENAGTRSNPKGTQIWFTYCRNDEYHNIVGMWFYMRPPWVYSGVNPMAGNTHEGRVSDCL